MIAIPYTSLKIQGFQALLKSQARFLSIKNYFGKEDSMHFIEFSFNANIKSFYLLLMNYIQRQHYKKLVFWLKAEQESIQSGFRRERKVSFNGKNNGVFADSEDGQTYTLHKLKTYIFAQNNQFQIIQNCPSKQLPKKTSKNVMPKYQPYLKRQFSSERLIDSYQSKNNQKDSTLSKVEIQRILAQFLKLLLPVSINKNYKSQIKSVNQLFTLYPTTSVALNILMRYILLTKYKMTEAKYYDQFLNDKTVFTSLCEAFGLDGLQQSQKGFQIKKEYKIYVMKWNSGQSQKMNQKISVQNFNQSLKNSKIRQTQTSQNKQQSKQSRQKSQQKVYVVAMPRESQQGCHSPNSLINLNLKKRPQNNKIRDKKNKDKQKRRQNLNFSEIQTLPKFYTYYEANIKKDSNEGKTQTQTQTQNQKQKQNQDQNSNKDLFVVSSQEKKEVLVQIQPKRQFFGAFRKSLKQIQTKRGSFKGSSQAQSPKSPSKKIPVDSKVVQQFNLSHSYHSNLQKADFQISNNEILDDIQKVLNLDF